jgi:hypothetical protein
MTTSSRRGGYRIGPAEIEEALLALPEWLRHPSPERRLGGDS